MAPVPSHEASLALTGESRVFAQLSFSVSGSRKRTLSWEPTTRLNPNCLSALWTCSLGEQYEAKAWWAGNVLSMCAVCLRQPDHRDGTLAGGRSAGPKAGVSVGQWAWWVGTLLPGHPH